MASRFSIRKTRLSRSTGGDIVIILFLLIGGAFMVIPMILIISNAFKPLNELFLFPPRLIVRNPTTKNFHDLMVMMAQSWVPFGRYLLNSLIIVTLGTLGNVFFGSLAAYVISVRRVPGTKTFMSIVVLSLMFTSEVTRIPNYVTIAFLGWLDSLRSIIIPRWSAPLGLYLVSRFIEGMIDRSLIEAAEIDGAGDFRIYWQIVMPNIKPAWLTMIILSFQELWRTQGGHYIYSEQLKTLPYALNQLAAQGGVARQGVQAAVTLIMMIVPIIVFLINQSKIVDTMGHSGMAN